MPLAQSMRTNVSRTIGFLVPDLTNYPNAAVAKAAEATLAEAGYAMLLADSDHDVKREARFLRLLRSRQVDGILLYLSDEDDPLVQATIGDLDIPVVVLDRTLPFGVDTVFSEHREAMRRTVLHLAGAGHRELALLLPDLRIRPVRERAAGFERGGAGGRSRSRAAERDPGRAAGRRRRRDPAPAGGRDEAERGADRRHAGCSPRRSRGCTGTGCSSACGRSRSTRSSRWRRRCPRSSASRAISPRSGAQAAQLMIDRLSGALSGPPRRIRLASRAVMAEQAALPARGRGALEVEC